MSTEAQILANRRLGRRIVLNLGHLDFDIVSDFDIRISDFNHSGCFMQNKPNLPAPQMNLTSVITKDYENKSNWKLGENKPNSKPICQRVKLMQSLYLQRIMKNNADKGYEKTKPKQTQFPKSQNEHNLIYHKEQCLSAVVLTKAETMNYELIAFVSLWWFLAIHSDLRRIIFKKSRPDRFPKKPVAAIGRTASAIIVSIIKSSKEFSLFLSSLITRR